MPPVRLTDRPTNKRGATVAPKVTVFSTDDRSNGDRFIKPQSAPQDYLGPRAEITELREQLLDELNHRLKNNLQILYGFLQIAQHKTNNAEAREVLSDTSRRIGAMGAAQQVFYSVRDSTDISGQSFIEAVCANARAFFSKEVSINFEDAKLRSSGLGLVMMLAQRLKGTFTVERRSGARCLLRFPDQ